MTLKSTLRQDYEVDVEEPTPPANTEKVQCVKCTLKYYTKNIDNCNKYSRT